MRLEQLDHLVTVVDRGSFRRAARALGITQPALSKSVAQLERDVGARILERSVRGVRPTAAGLAFLPYARAIRSDLARAREEAARSLGEVAGRVAIGTSPAPAYRLIPRAVARMSERWPGVFVRLVEALPPSSLQALRDGSLDLVVGPLPEEPRGAQRGLEQRVLFRSQIVIATRRGHPLERARSLCELAGARWARAGTPEGPARVVDEAFRSAGLPPPRYTVECESVLALEELAAASDLVAVLPRQAYERARLACRLVRIAVRERIGQVDIALLRRARMPETAAVRAFLDILEELARSEPA